MEQTIINGFRVMIFSGYDGTQLFINNPVGDTIYAHRVSGDAIERAKVIIAANTTVESFEPVKADKMICIAERRAEFSDALVRGKNSDLEVYSDWDKDAFVVVNNDNNAEYRVHLEARSGQLFGDCECKDFQFRRRLCKHISAVLVDCVFNQSAKV